MAKQERNASNSLETESQRESKTESVSRFGERAKTADSSAVKWIKALLVGAFASLVMYVIMVAAIASGLAPFNLPPSAAFLEYFGLNIGPLALLLHFTYGALWSLVFVGLFQEKATVAKGILLALVLWLVMMIGYSPSMGWGFFGFGSGAQLPSNHPLYLAPGPKYVIATLLLHLLYGSIIGWLNPAWIKFKPSGPIEKQAVQSGTVL